MRLRRIIRISMLSLAWLGRVSSGRQSAVPLGWDTKSAALGRIMKWDTS